MLFLLPCLILQQEKQIHDLQEQHAAELASLSNQLLNSQQHLFGFKSNVTELNLKMQALQESLNKQKLDFDQERNRMIHDHDEQLAEQEKEHASTCQEWQRKLKACEAEKEAWSLKEQALLNQVTLFLIVHQFLSRSLTFVLSLSCSPDRFPIFALRCHKVNLPVLPLPSPVNQNSHS